MADRMPDWELSFLEQQAAEQQEAERQRAARRSAP
jgi:hypothetical protein